MDRCEEIFRRIVEQGEVAIDGFIEDRKSEELFLDFKRSSDSGKGTKLSDRDRNNFAKAISGFGNSEGGVIVWGIDCSNDLSIGDVAKAKHPIVEPTRFASWLNGSVSGCTVPPHQHVQNEVIHSIDTKEGYVISFIPKSNLCPHQTVGDSKYFIRAGSSFMPSPHGVLAGMFGKSPRPSVYVLYVTSPADIDEEGININFGIQIYNEGPGIARDLFINIIVISVPGENSKLWFEPAKEYWDGNFLFGRKLNLISKPDIRLAPEAHLQPVIMRLHLKPPFVNDLSVDGSLGCQDSPTFRFKFENSAQNIQAIYEETLRRALEEKLSTDDRNYLIQRILNINL
jgi:hypothetical protein